MNLLCFLAELTEWTHYSPYSLKNRCCICQIRRNGEEKQVEKKIRQYITEVNNTISGHTLFLGNTFIAQIRRLAT